MPRSWRLLHVGTKCSWHETTCAPVRSINAFSARAIWLCTSHQLPRPPPIASQTIAHHRNRTVHTRGRTLSLLCLVPPTGSTACCGGRLLLRRLPRLSCCGSADG